MSNTWEGKSQSQSQWAYGTLSCTYQNEVDYNIEQKAN